VLEATGGADKSEVSTVGDDESTYGSNDGDEG
jgi:hypothetical protein